MAFFSGFPKRKTNWKMLKTVEEMLGLNYQDAWVHGERRYSNSFKKRMRQNVEWLSLVQDSH